MKKGLKAALILCICAITVAICGIFAGCNIDFEGIYDDDAKISSTNSYTAVGQITTVRSRSAEVSCHSFSGADTLYKRFEVDDGTSLDLTINYTGEEGKLKVVLCGKEGVFVLKEVGLLGEDKFIEQTSGKVDLTEIPDGTYKLKIVGVKAEFNLALSF